MDDLISRQSVIDKINERQRKLIYCFGFDNDMVKIMNIAKSLVIAIPSAQPEFIRCRDCKHWDKTWTNDWSPDYHYCPMIDGVRKGDFYCADAERRTDE